MVQVVQIGFKTPEGIKKVQFMGPSAFSKEEWEEVKQRKMEDIFDWNSFAIFPPEDPAEYPDDEQMKDLKEGIQAMAKQVQGEGS